MSSGSGRYGEARSTRTHNTTKAAAAKPASATAHRLLVIDSATGPTLLTATASSCWARTTASTITLTHRSSRFPGLRRQVRVHGLLALTASVGLVRGRLATDG